jgi:hypothetical protein
MGNEEVLDLLHLLDLGPILLSEQTLGLLLVFYARDEETLALFTLRRLPWCWRRTFLWGSGTVGLDVAGGGLLSSGIGRGVVC